MSLVALQHVGSSRTRNQTHVPYIGRWILFFFFLIYLFLFLAVLGLHSCTQAFSSCGEQGLLFIVVR